MYANWTRVHFKRVTFSTAIYLQMLIKPIGITNAILFTVHIETFYTIQNLYNQANRLSITYKLQKKIDRNFPMVRQLFSY